MNAPKPKPDMGQQFFKDFSWPEGKIPPALSGEPLALKLGIIDDIIPLLPQNEHQAIQQTLAKWTRSYRYLYAIADPASVRHDLQARPIDSVTEKHRKVAFNRIQAKQTSKIMRDHEGIHDALDAIERMFSDPSRENLTAAKRASAKIRKMIGKRPDSTS